MSQKNRTLDGIAAIGVDEIQVGKGHQYLTVMYQLDLGYERLLHVGMDRTVRSFLGFFRILGKEISAEIKFVCSDLWKAYLKSSGKSFPTRCTYLTGIILWQT